MKKYVLLFYTAQCMQCSTKKNKKAQQPFHYKNVQVKCERNQTDAEQTPDTSEHSNLEMSRNPAKCGTVSFPALKMIEQLCSSQFPPVTPVSRLWRTFFN